MGMHNQELLDMVIKIRNVIIDTVGEISKFIDIDEFMDITTNLMRKLRTGGLD